jgi:pimeloyl-ACP methyl ester carboxylesterase
VTSDITVPADVGIGLIHGGLHASWCWERLTPLLKPPTVAVDLPGREGRPEGIHTITASDWARSAAAQIGELPARRLILVGHSLGGLTTLNVAKLLPDRVALLVLVSALVPADGQTVAELLGAGYHPRTVSDVGPLLDETGAFPVPPYDITATLLANDMPEDDARGMYARLRAEPNKPFLEPFDANGMPDVPRLYIRCARDHAVPWEMQEAMIQNLGGAQEAVIDAGHNVMMSQPGALAGVLNDQAQQLAGGPR